MTWDWRCCILISKACFSWNILPKESLFHFLMHSLRCLSFYWNWNMRVPLIGGEFSHQSLSFSLNFGWRSQNFSKWKGLWGLTPTFSHSKVIGQWSDLATGRTTALRMPPAIMNDSDSRNLSSLQAIPLSPDCLLFHVKIPLEFLTSIRSRSEIALLKRVLVECKLRIPPFFPQDFLSG